MRLVDADAIEKQAYDDLHFYAEVENWEFDLVTHYLDTAKTVDAVPVVRCSECVLNENCTVQDIFRLVAGIENPFCCVGKRKDGDGNGI